MIFRIEIFFYQPCSLFKLFISCSLDTVQDFFLLKNAYTNTRAEFSIAVLQHVIPLSTSLGFARFLETLESHNLIVAFPSTVMSSD